MTMQMDVPQESSSARWKIKENVIKWARVLWLLEVAEDGVTFPEGPIIQILEADREEERNVVEGPWIHYR